MENGEEKKEVRNYTPRSKKYLLDHHRYNELRSFCRQYPQWKRELQNCYGLKAISQGSVRSSTPSDPTERTVEAAEIYIRKIELVENTAREADPALAKHIIANVAEGFSYEMLERKGKRPPCGVRQFYEARAKFYFLLSAKRQ